MHNSTLPFTAGHSANRKTRERRAYVLRLCLTVSLMRGCIDDDGMNAAEVQLASYLPN
jgi:hypothetical protein